MPDIRFLIIGAQKAGTTSLFEYMRRHPEIHMPSEKEISFFSRRYPMGVEWYTNTVVRGASPNAVCGEASVGYMCGTPHANIAENERLGSAADDRFSEPLENIIPRRIKALLPDVRLICLLRDPVERAYSHYQMAILEGAEQRSFDDAIASLLTDQALQTARVTPTASNGYIVNGEYHRVLAGYLQVFPREQLLVVFSDELSSNTSATLIRIYDFLGVSPNFLPDNLGVRYRAAATERRISGFDLYSWQEYMAKFGPLRTFWHGLPAALRTKIDRSYRLISYRMTMWNARRGEPASGISDETQALLARYYLSDSEALGQLLGLEIPWLAQLRQPTQPRR